MNKAFRWKYLAFAICGSWEYAEALYDTYHRSMSPRDALLEDLSYA